MTDADKAFASIIGAARELFDTPAVKAYYRRRAAALKGISDREDRLAREKREAAEQERQRARSYDNYVLSGGSDECFREGMRGNCGENCAIWRRGECEHDEDQPDAGPLGGQRNADDRSSGGQKALPSLCKREGETQP